MIGGWNGRRKKCRQRRNKRFRCSEASGFGGWDEDSQVMVVKKMQIFPGLGSVRLARTRRYAAMKFIAIIRGTARH